MYQGSIKLLSERDIARRPHYMHADLATASAICGEPATEIVRRHVLPGDGQGSAYHRGAKPPNYPVPATMDNAMLALYHSPHITVWSVQWMKRELKR